jgi:ubiquitin thioesterase OTU1
MKIRLRAPSGTSTLTVEDTATVQDLRRSISEATSLSSFDIKWGFPPKPLDLSQFHVSTPLSQTGLKLNGEQLIVEASSNPPKPPSSAMDMEDSASAPKPSQDSQGSSQSASQSSTSTTTEATRSRGADEPLSLERAPRNIESDPPEIPVPSHEATVVLRVMPDDNSCMFRAFGSAVLSDTLDAMTELRSTVAQGIQAQPDLYNAAVLQKSPDDYCRWIQREDSWGGDIELSILSQAFNVEVCSINVQDLRVDRFNEGQKNRIILVYSGIHYDTIALSPSEPPYTKAIFPPELDLKVFDSIDDEVLEKARELCKVLQSRHYYTDTSGFTIKCNKCGWTGNGERGAQKHAEQTGHYDFAEAQ